MGYSVRYSAEWRQYEASFSGAKIFIAARTRSEAEKKAMKRFDVASTRGITITRVRTPEEVQAEARRQSEKQAFRAQYDSIPNDQLSIIIDHMDEEINELHARLEERRDLREKLVLLRVFRQNVATEAGR